MTMTEVTFKSLEIKTAGNGMACSLEVSGVLYVKETVMNLHLIKSIPQGVNPKELVLEFSFDDKRNEAKEVYNPFHYTRRMTSRDQFTSIRLIYDGWISESYDVRR